MINEIINDVYVELDCLIDTRLSLMYDIDKNLMRDIISNNNYKNRFVDQFGYISVRLFRILYSMRNEHILDNPTSTEVVDLISDYCLESTISSKKHGEFKRIKVHLNIYPYNLTEENIELLRMAIFNSSKMDIEVEIINKPINNIEPTFLRENVGLAIMYDALTWIEKNTQNKKLINCSIPDVMLITPMLVHRNIIISDKELIKFFEDVETNISPLVNLKYIPTKIFSMKNKKDT